MKGNRFWMKLTDDFLNSVRIRRLERQADGHSFVLLLIHLLSDTKDSGGVFIIDMGDEWQRYDVDAICEAHPSFSAKFVTDALDKFISMGLLENSADGYLQFTDYEQLTNTPNAAKQQRYRDRQRAKANDNKQHNDVSNDVGNNVGNNVTTNVTYSQSQSQSLESKSIAQSDNQTSSSSSWETAAKNAGIILTDELHETAHKLNENVLIFAITKTLEAHPSNATAYFRRTIQSYIDRGFKTIDDLQSAERERSATKTAQVSNTALDYQQRPADEFDYEIDNDWMQDYIHP